MSHRRSNTRSATLERARERLLDGLGVPTAGKFEIDEFQREAIANVVDGHDTLVVAPTGSGKTYIALESIKAVLDLKLRAAYTTPLKALSNTKFNELKKIFEPKHKVGLLTGDRKIDGDAGVVIATTEIYRNELYRAAERYSLVVLDEVHFIADPQRGAVWEESIILTPPSTTLLMLSASISNPDEIAAWVSEARGKPCRIVIKKDRPVPLRFGFMHPDLGVMPLNSGDGSIFPEVLNYYIGSKLDTSGMRVQQQGLRGKPWRRSGGGGGGPKRRGRGRS
jgi:ATP-dependent RNA helicase HelY